MGFENGQACNTACQIVANDIWDVKQNFAAVQGTVLMALLQPAPEVYDLFDDIMLLCEGKRLIDAFSRSTSTKDGKHSWYSQQYFDVRIFWKKERVCDIWIAELPCEM